jgi:hypothetical protein
MKKSIPWSLLLAIVLTLGYTLSAVASSIIRVRDWKPSDVSYLGTHDR